MDSATPCLHKGHIFGSIKLVAVIFCAHLRTQCYGKVVFNYCSFFRQHLDIQNCISNIQVWFQISTVLCIRFKDIIHTLQYKHFAGGFVLSFSFDYPLRRSSSPILARNSCSAFKLLGWVCSIWRICMLTTMLRRWLCRVRRLVSMATWFRGQSYSLRMFSNYVFISVQICHPCRWALSIV